MTDLEDKLTEAIAFWELWRSRCAPMWDAWQTAKPPCTECGGTKGAWAPSGRLGGQHPRSADKWQPCPACVDHPGVQSFTEWVAGVIAVWTAVRDYIERTPPQPWATVEEAFRQIGGIR